MAGVRQNAVSRAENARAIPNPETLPALLAVLGASAEEREAVTTLVRKARATHPENVPARVILERGSAHFQARILDLEDQAVLVRSFHPTAILGVLQSLAYATAVFRGHGTDEEQARSVAQRLARHRSLLDGSDRRWVLIQTEGALRWNFAGAGVMARQLDHLADVVRAGNERVRIGVIPAMRHTPVQYIHGFHIYDFADRRYRRDPRMAQVGTLSGTALLGEALANEYVPLFEQLAQLAVYEDEACALIERIAEQYRGEQD